MPRKISGFSLMEMALVLIIIGVISGITLPALNVMLNWQKAKSTAHHQEQILYALASYVNQYKALPFPADPTKSNGAEDKASHRRRGIVPYTDLGLPESVAKDGYQRWFTYVIDDYYADTPKLSIPGSPSQPPENKLCATHKHPNNLNIKGLKENIALALISHGPEGRGAYPNPLATPPQGEEEIQNTTSDREIIDRPSSQDPAHPFSHKVVWVTAKNLLAIYGHAPCPPVPEVIPLSGGAQYQPPQRLDLKK